MDSEKLKSVEARRARTGVVLGLPAAAIGLLALYGFTVDDALITARVAHHLATGVGHRMNPGGSPVDAVTPLGFAHLLAPFAKSGVLGAFSAARVIGVVAWLTSAAIVGALAARVGWRPIRYAPLGLMAVSAPLGAWPSSGMETGLVTLLSTLALVPSRWAPLAAGFAAAWRPELLPWAMALAIGTAIAKTSRPGPALAAFALAVAPAACVAIARGAFFGAAMPLAALAKPSSLDEGLLYATRALLLTGIPFLVVSRALARVDRHLLAVLSACLVHFASMALAGGDWMPLFRLVVPILPGLLLVGAGVAECSPVWATLVRLALAIAASVWIWIDTGRAARHVVAQRLAAIAAAREPLAGAKHVATIDAGWVGAATSAEVVDVAGVTDPKIARLPGGHTSKSIPENFLEQRDVDAVLVLHDRRLPEPSHFRMNDRRLALLAEAHGFTRRATIPLAKSSFEYVIWRR